MVLKFKKIHVDAPAFKFSMKPPESVFVFVCSTIFGIPKNVRTAGIRRKTIWPRENALDVIQ